MMPQPLEVHVVKVQELNPGQSISKQPLLQKCRDEERHDADRRARSVEGVVQTMLRTCGLIAAARDAHAPRPRDFEIRALPRTDSVPEHSRI
ncbi:hypothetical protein MRB53_041408 [Persea americana]|nr:hypothetical protein MRB53_041408 [Persea americana]